MSDILYFVPGSSTVIDHNFALDTQLADQCRKLRSDNAALRAALERSQSERDAWRIRANDAQFRFEQMKVAVLRLFKEA